MPHDVKPDDPALRKVIDKQLVHTDDRVFVLDHEGAFQYRRDEAGPVKREPIGPLCTGRR